MRKKLRSIVSVSYITIIFLLFTILLSNIILIHNNTASAQEEKKLVITPLDSYTVDTGQLFSVRVTDGTSEDAYVSGVKVTIQSYGGTKITDNNGVARLTAPSDDWRYDEFTIIANKSGYADGRITIGLNKKGGFLESIIQSPYFPIFIASICLIGAIVYVTFRQKKSIYTRAKEITDDKVLEKYDADVKIVSPKTDDKIQKPEYYSKEIVRAKAEQDPKVEEIRISRPYKEKEIVPVKTEEDKTEKIIDQRISQINDQDWFEGTDEMRYEIEKLTGEIDENGIDKWFEGVDELKEKIDKKMRKKTKNID